MLPSESSQSPGSKNYNMAQSCSQLLLLCSLLQRLSIAHAFSTLTHRKKVHHLTAADLNEFEETSNRSIGEVVSNLHGGKYQFQDSHLAGATRLGQEFADSLYASDGIVEENDDDEMPKWAIRMMDPLLQMDKPVSGTLFFGNGNIKHTITIKNDERSWEKFYAFVHPLKQEQQGIKCPFEMHPTIGTLAPRGGASNACDANTPYSDSTAISVKIIDDNSAGEYLLVVGTEAEVMRYVLKAH